MVGCKDYTILPWSWLTIVSKYAGNDLPPVAENRIPILFHSPRNIRFIKIRHRNAKFLQRVSKRVVELERVRYIYRSTFGIWAFELPQNFEFV